MREPAQPPPSLVSARVEVNKVILDEKLRQSDAASVAIKHWHEEVKTWQDNDELVTAFLDGRLTLRTMTHTPPVDYNYSAENPKGDSARKRILGIINNDNYNKPITSQAEKENGGWVAGQAGSGTMLLDAGGAGIMKRLIPENFHRSTLGAQSNKNSLGLHALSASLLNPDGYVLKRYDNANLVVLMPLPLADDVKLFYELRDLSKTGGCQSFKNAVVILGSEFTRPQLASNLDMGTTYTMTTSARHGGSSFKYVRGASGQTTTESPEQCRTNARTDYRTILKTTATGSNEITVAYRKWGREGHFPIFGVTPTRHSPDYTEVVIKLAIPKPKPRWGGGDQHQNANYAETGFLIRKQDFVRRKK
jgi:hypothetical protein